LIILGITTTLFITGCSVSKINYEGKKRTYDDVEEIIEDKLEAQNIGLDLEVDISKEVKKKKKRR
jgi:hypothetical protein